MSNKITTYFIDSKTVILFSEAFNLICSRLRSWFSLSIFALAFNSASNFLISFLCLNSISCSIVAFLMASCLATESSCRLRFSSFIFCCWIN